MNFREVGLCIYYAIFPLHFTLDFHDFTLSRCFSNASALKTQSAKLARDDCIVCCRAKFPAMTAVTIVHDTSEAVELCPLYGLYLKPIVKMTICVALPKLKHPWKYISNWAVMEKLKSMVHNHQFSMLRITKTSVDFIHFEGEVENSSLLKSFLACLDGKTIKLRGVSDILKVRAAEFKIDFPTLHDWESFFRDTKDMSEMLPRERPDTIHLEGLPCNWFALKKSGSEKPSEDVLVKVFEKFGEIRRVDIPMLDPYREEITRRNLNTFSFCGHLNFEAYVQYCEYTGFMQAMSALRGMKLMYKGEDGKAMACNIKVRPGLCPEWQSHSGLFRVGDNITTDQ